MHESTASESPTISPPIDKSLIADMPIEALARRYRLGIELFDKRIFTMTDEQLDSAFLPDAGIGTWPIRVLLGHLADADLATVHRIRRMVAEDSPVLSTWDENEFIDSGIYGSTSGDWPAPAHPIGAFVAVVYTLREWTAAWLLGLPAESLSRQGMHPEHGSITVRSAIETDTWHLEHHTRFLNAKVLSILGPAPESACEGEQPEGGCGKDSCCCHHDETHQ